MRRMRPGLVTELALCPYTGFPVDVDERSTVENIQGRKCLAQPDVCIQIVSCVGGNLQDGDIQFVLSFREHEFEGYPSGYS